MTQLKHPFDQEYQAWKDKLGAYEKNNSQSTGRFSTWSDLEVPVLCTPKDTENLDYLKELGFPGEYPYTRGVHANMYRGKMWTMRQFAGFGTASDTNRRYKSLLENGQTGLSVAFHMPTLMGIDSDSPLAKGEVGKCGVAVDTLVDMEDLFSGIDLEQVSTSMTINSPAPVLLAMYVVLAEKLGVSRSKIRGTLQNDILKEYIAQKEWIYPPEPSVKLIADTLEFCTKELPQWNSISISGYHIREAGATAVQELAFTLADGIAYVQAGIDRGLNVDDFAPRLSFFWDVHNDFFEEIAKFRAGRRMWARIMRDRFKAKNPKSWMLRTHAQTAGVSLTAQQPLNNVVRVAVQALAAILGGTNSLHTNALDETLALPTEESALVALRTQQVLAEETGVANVVDPLGGSYFIEWLTNKVEEDALKYIHRIDELGGMTKAIHQGYPQAEIAQASYHFQKLLEKNQKVMVGVNKYASSSEKKIDVLYIDENIEKLQIQKLHSIKASRDSKKVTATINDLKKACREDQNTMPFIIECVRTYATVQEICDAMKEVYGAYRDPGTF